MKKNKINNKNSSNLEPLSFLEIHQMYSLVLEHLNSRLYGRCNDEIKNLIKNKFKELESELFRRIYGFNPFDGLNDPSVSASNIMKNEKKPSIISLNKIDLQEK